MDVEQRLKICRLIEAIIAADGMIHPEERAFLERVVQRFDVQYAVAAVGPIDQGPVSDPGRASRLLRQLEPDVKARVMALLVESAIADGTVVPSEHALLLVAAAALEIDATAVEERIAKRLKSG
jgi:uncharacterized tellurite resistance protein B-like protein